jgi:hypothetical protein
VGDDDSDRPTRRERQARERASYARARAAELAVRRRELAEQIKRQGGSNAFQADTAHQRLDEARHAAARSAESAEAAIRRAADTHDQAASLHEWLGQVRLGDPVRHRAAAAEHRLAAAADRARLAKLHGEA